MSKEEFVGAFIELTPNDAQEGIDFRFGWNFPEDMDPAVIDLYKNLIAGIFGLMSAQDEEILSVGQIVRNVSGFDESVVEVNLEDEIVFTPDPELLKSFEQSKVIDISKFRPKGDE